MKINIISHFGLTPEMQEKRRAFHNTQLEYIIKHWPDAEITVVAQEYKPEWYDEQVTEYIKTGQLTTAAARNILLKRFYDSTDDWALFMDDDCIFDDRLQPQEFVRSLMNGDFNDTDADIITPIFGRFQPIHGVIKDNQHILDQCYYLKSTTMLKTTAFFLRNLRKRHGHGMFFDERFNSLVDAEFGLRAYLRGFTQYNNLALSAIDLGSSISSLMSIIHDGKDPGSAESRQDQNYHTIMDFYKKSNLVRPTIKYLEVPHTDWLWDYEYEVTQNKKQKKYNLVKSVVKRLDTGS